MISANLSFLLKTSATTHLAISRLLSARSWTFPRYNLLPTREPRPVSWLWGVGPQPLPARRVRNRSQAEKGQQEGEHLTAMVPAAAPADLGLADVTMLLTDTSSTAGFLRNPSSVGKQVFFLLSIRAIRVTNRNARAVTCRPACLAQPINYAFNVYTL